MRSLVRGDVLVVDDDADVRDALELLLQVSGFRVALATSGEGALASLRERPFDVAIIDLQLPGIGGLGVIREAAGIQPDLESVIVTANGTFTTAVEALRAGAYDFLEKPFSNEQVVRVLERAVERRRLVRAAEEHRERSEAMATLQAVTHASGSSLVVSEILDAALAIVRDRLSTETAAVLLRTLDPMALSIERAIGLELGATTLPADDPLVRMAIRRCEPVSAEMREGGVGALATALWGRGMVSVAIAPIADGGSCLGVLLAASARSKPWSAAEQTLFQSIAAELAPPIMNARIHAQATRRAAQLKSVDEIVRLINGEHDLEGVLELVTRRAASLVGAHRCEAWLPDGEGDALRLATAGTIDGGRAHEDPSPTARRHLAEVFHAGIARVETTAEGARMLCPMVHQGATLGLLTAWRARGPDGDFGGDDLTLLDMLASHAAIAVDNARMHATERAQSARLEARVNERTRELEAAQEQLVRRERLAILGRMAGSISHEIRNPLGVLRNAVYYLKMVLSAQVDEDVMHHITMMEEEIDRANRIVGDLLDYARVRAPVLKPVALSTVLARALRENHVPPGVTVVRDFDPDAPSVTADAEQLRVVFGNLVRNAVQAMGPAGTLSVRVHALDGQVQAEVSDTGPGISPEVRDHLFEPLFTTKTKGLGLGLSTARNLLEAQHGSIAVESVRGGGATFRVSLPAAGVRERSA